MNRDDEYRQQPAEAERQARLAMTEIDRAAWQKVAQGWLSLLRSVLRATTIPNLRSGAASVGGLFQYSAAALDRLAQPLHGEFEVLRLDMAPALDLGLELLLGVSPEPAKATIVTLVRDCQDFRPESFDMANQCPPAHPRRVFLSSRRWTLRRNRRCRTAISVRLSLSAINLRLFPASTISRNSLSSSGSHGRFLLKIILRRAARTRHGAVR